MVEGETREHGRPRGLIANVTAAFVALAMLIAGIATSPREPDLSAFPLSALPQLPAGPGLLNRYDWGGFLIWYAPATPVFVDGRLFPYVGEALDDRLRTIELCCFDVDQGHVDAGAGQHLRDAAAHGAGADDRGAVDGPRRRLAHHLRRF